jgi:hypothetical protein
MLKKTLSLTVYGVISFCVSVFQLNAMEPGEDTTIIQRGDTSRGALTEIEAIIRMRELRSQLALGAIDPAFEPVVADRVAHLQGLSSLSESDKREKKRKRVEAEPEPCPEGRHDQTRADAGALEERLARMEERLSAVEDLMRQLIQVQRAHYPPGSSGSAIQ